MGPRTLLLLSSLLLASPALAEITIRIDSTVQEVDVDHPTGLLNGNCTLGEAILAANTRSLVDGCDGISDSGELVILELARGTYVFDRPGVTLAPGDVSVALPTLSVDLRIQGNGAVLSNTSTWRFGFFQFTRAEAAELRLELWDMTMEGGAPSAGRDNTGAFSRSAAFVSAHFSDFTGPNTTFELVMDTVTMRDFIGSAVSLPDIGLLDLDNVTVIGRPPLSDGLDILSDGGPLSDPRPVNVNNSSFRGVGDALNLRGNFAVVVEDSEFSDNDRAVRMNLVQGSLDVQRNRFEHHERRALSLNLSPNLGRGTLAVTSSDNEYLYNASARSGGAIYISNIGGAEGLGWTFSSNRDRFVGNTAGEGGAIKLEGWLAASAVITGALFEANRSSIGAAIDLDTRMPSPPIPTVIIEQSAFIENYAPSGTGIINNTQDAPNFSIRSSTFDSNHAGEGGIINASAELEGVTMTNNFARAMVSVPGQQINESLLRNTVTNGNQFFAASSTGAVCDRSDTFTDAGGNYIEDDSCTGFTSVADPQLGPLQLNCGPTPNRLPAAGSPLIDAGVMPVLELDFDQRGATRDFGLAPDIGAVERRGDRDTGGPPRGQPRPSTPRPPPQSCRP